MTTIITTSAAASTSTSTSSSNSISSAGPPSASALAAHLLSLATLRLLTLSPDARFSHVRQIPLRILEELTARYLALLAGTSKEIAQQAGRTAINAKDVVEAIEELGGRMKEVWEWCEDRRLGGEGVQMANSGPVEPATLGAMMKDTARMSTQQKVSQILEYGPINTEEEQDVHPVNILPDSSMVATPDTSPLSPSRSPSPPPPSYAEATKLEMAYVLESDKAEDELIKDAMDFLPPLPDHKSEQENLQIIEEDESGRTVKRARRAMEGGGAGTASWQRSVLFDTSALAEVEVRPLPNASLLDLAISEGPDAASASSLLYFLETFNHISLDPHLSGGQDALPLRQNAKRRRAATAIHSNILNPSDDSLCGAIPTPQPRHAKKQAGWIPYPTLNPNRQDPSEPSGKAVIPFPQLHPFSTQLPPSMTEALPTVVLPHPTRILAPLMHPRYPTAHSSIRTLLEQAHGGLFNRTTRLGPPGPLLDTGAAGYYDVELERPNIIGWPGETAPRMMSWNFEWEIGNENEDITGRASSTAHPPGSSLVLGSSTHSNHTGPSFPSLPLRQPQAQLQVQQQQQQTSQFAQLRPSPALQPISPQSTVRLGQSAPAHSSLLPSAPVEEPIRSQNPLLAAFEPSVPATFSSQSNAFTDAFESSALPSLPFETMPPFEPLPSLPPMPVARPPELTNGHHSPVTEALNGIIPAEGHDEDLLHVATATPMDFEEF